jgi:hypothetical protein
MKIVALILSVGLLASCSTNTEDSNDKSQSALTLVKKVCNGDNDLSWEERAELAAQANYLDKRWERLADATNYQAAILLISKTLKTGTNYSDYPEPALTKIYESNVAYAKYLAECSILELIDQEDK